jgi:hypothetical protein
VQFGKVIAFPTAARKQRPVLPADPLLPVLPNLPAFMAPAEPLLPSVIELPPTLRQRRRRLLTMSQLTQHGWLFVAWIVAFTHLQAAIERAEVFGVVDTLAFLVAVVMPVLRIRAALEYVTRVSRARARAQRRESIHDISKSA